MIRVKNLRVRYGGALIIRGIDLQIPKGEVAALVGPNGAGKTTTLKAIMGLVKHEGTVEVDGVDISNWPPHARAHYGVGYSPETRDLFPSLTVYENLALPIRALKLKPDRLELVLHIIPPLKTLLHRQAHTLSGGQQKLVALARALIVGKRALLLDEVFEGIAIKLADDIKKYLKDYIKTENPTTIIAESTTQYTKDIATIHYHIDRGELTTH